MSDSTSLKNGSSAGSAADPSGQTALASGESLAMRLWEEAAGEAGTPHTRPYETVGYVVSGRVEVHVAGTATAYGAGESYLVPAGAERNYVVVEDLVAVEATSPPAEVHSRDA